MSTTDLLTKLEERVKEVEERVRDYAEAIIGRVSASDVVTVSTEGARIIVDVPFDNYEESKVRISDYLGIATIVHETLVLGRVVEVQRSHVMGLAGVAPVFGAPSDYTGIATPARIVLEPLTECPMDGFESCEPNTVHTPIDPLSIVFKPKREVLMKMLQLPREGVLVGKLYSGGEVVEDVDIRLPVHSLYEHVLVVGTTGSGKTVLLKNLALALLNEVRDSVVIALDLQGDYPHLTIPNPSTQNPVLKPVDSITVIEPITRDYIQGYEKLIDEYANEYLERFLGEEGATINDVNNPETLAEALGYALLKLFLRNTYPNAEVEEINVSATKQDAGTAVLNEVNAKVKAKVSTAEGRGIEREFSIRFVPWSLRFSDVYMELARIFPVFSERVGIILPRVLENAMLYINKGIRCDQQLTQKGERCPEIKKEGKSQAEAQTRTLAASTQVDLDKLLEHQACIELATTCLRLAWQQRDNIIRGLHMLGRLGIMDVKHTINNMSVLITEPGNYRDLLGGLVILDLRLFREEPTAASMVVYRVLSRVFEVRDEELRMGREPRPTFILIDEAHNYFPQTGRGFEDFNKDVVESMINKITRLGRVRRIGVVFATHTPEDLNNLILQLTNTKIALRSEEGVLEKVGLKDYAEELVYAPDGVSVIKSYVFRTHAITMKTLPPQTMHRSHK
ncbi:MAG: ATP-binding protein [Vulcanisaeta sp.]|nr:ATP-binding protein [Vulcanisaeta sp.]